VADHGESLGEHDEATHGFFLYESTLRVPWIVRGPGVRAGRRVDTPVSAVCVTPTILHLLGIAPPDGIDGTSVLPSPAGAGAEAPDVFAEALFPHLNFGWSGTRSIRRGRWKLIEAPTVELYDLQADPKELHDVAADHADVVDDLRERLHAHADRGGAMAAGAAAADPAMRERLQGLGYVGAGGGGGGADTTEADLWDFHRRSPRDMIHVFRDLEQLPQAVLGGTPEEANALIERLRAADPGNIPILKLIAKLRLRAGQLPEAEAACREIVQNAPGDVDGLRTLATVQIRREEDAAATETIRRILALDPADAEGRLRLAPLLAKAGKANEAIAVLRDGIARSPDNVDLLNNLAWRLANGSVDAAEGLRYARHAREIAPDDPAVLDTFGWAAIRAGQAGEAVEPLRRALDLTNDPEVRAHLGVALSESGEAADGKALLDAAVKARPELARIPEVAKWRSRLR
jgi:Flp pilus assembly protein TadD